MRVLVPIDGSKSALRALKYALSLREKLLKPLSIDLLNVQRRIASGNVRRFVPQEQLDDYYQDEGKVALRSARKAVQASGVPFAVHIAVGDEPECIAAYAKEHDCELIVMGTRGMNTLENMLLGSVSTRVVHLAPVPVLLVK